MDPFAWIAEQRIKEAMDGGAFDERPQERTPPVDDDGVLRVAYRLLRNADVLPLEGELRRELESLHGRLGAVPEGAERDALRHQVHDTALRLVLLSRIQ
jgi:hypothetical protein